MNTVTVLGIASIVIGFLCIAVAFYTFMKKYPVVWPAAFGVGAFIFVTVIPVFLAVFFATVPGDVAR